MLPLLTRHPVDWESFFSILLDHRNDGFNSAVGSVIAGELGKPGGVTDTLATLNTTVTRVETTLTALQPFIHDVIMHQFETAAKLPAVDLRERLPAVKHLVKVAQDQHVTVNTTFVNNLSKKLLQVQPQTSDFWQTAGVLASYKTALQNPDLWATRDFPDCRNVPPSSKSNIEELLSHPPESPSTITPWVYKNCRFVLDDWLQFINQHRHLIIEPGEPDAQGMIVRKHLTAGYVFDSVLVVYRGGAVGKADFDFKNCIFEIDLPGQPAGPKVRAMVLALLTPQNNYVKLSSS